MVIRIPKIKNRTLIFFVLCLGLYIVLKIYRNSMNADTGTQGGLWNVINLMFVGFAFLQQMMGYKALRTKPKAISWGYRYAYIAFFLSMFSIGSLNIASLFSWLMIFYFPSVIQVFYVTARKDVDAYTRGGISLTIYVVSFFCLILMLRRIMGAREIYQSDMYFLLCLIPFVLLWKKGMGFYIPLLITVAVIILSGKRTATLAIVGAVATYYFLQMKMERNLKAFFKLSFRVIVVVALVMIVYNYLAERYNITLLKRLENLAKDGGSGRDEIYTALLLEIKNSEFYRWFVGYGNSAVTKVFGRSSSAHNDFIEIMFDYGILAVAAIVGFYVSMYQECKRMVRYQYPGAPAFAASLVIAIMMSMFSNFMITFTHISGIAAFWGIALAEWKSYQLQIAPSQH